MKYLIITILIISGISISVKTDAALFDWSNGMPAVTDDNTTTTYYDWSNGMPAVIYQYQSEAAPTSTPASVTGGQADFWFD